jgi:hypothetical protein
MLHANWEVMWVVRHKGENHIIVKDFDHDFVGARDLYVKVKKTDRKMVTLRCRNVGFPPPEQTLEKMLAYNKQRVWWCPYCMELRRFERRAWTEIDGHLYAADPKYYCPLCDISHTDAYVIQYNPLAQRLMYGRRSRSRGRKKRGRSRRK